MANPSSSVLPPAPHAASGPPSAYEDVDMLRSSDGIVAIISQRRSSGLFTFGIFKAFERDGRFERSSFVPEHMVESYLDMVTLVRTRIAELMLERDRAATAALTPGPSGAKTGQVRSGRK